MKLGLVTYQLAAEWDVPTIIQKCQATGFQGVELRTTHKHGVEVTLNPAQRAEVRKRFEDSGVEIAGLGSTFEYDAVDPSEVRRNIEGTKEYVKLAADLGCPGVKVRPNKLHEEEGIPVAKTLEQIGLALRECGEFAQNFGVQIRLEVHGRGTSHIPHIKTIMDVANHPNVFVCWNSNPGETINGSIRKNFNLLKDKIALVHMRDLFIEDYPWRELLRSLKRIGYQGYTLAEIPASPDAERVMKYYRALWLAYQR